MKLVVGLGNPGKQYEKTRHNFGEMVVRQLGVQIDPTLVFKQSKFLGELAEVAVKNEKVALFVPTTYMNNSGQAVQSIAQYFQVELSDCLVVHDELDLPLGRMKFAQNGSSGGNNGIASIIQHLGSKEFCRLRLGIGKPTHKQETVDYVLHRFSKLELNLVEEIMETAHHGIIDFVDQGIDYTMNRYNAKTQ